MGPEILGPNWLHHLPIILTRASQLAGSDLGEAHNVKLDQPNRSFENLRGRACRETVFHAPETVGWKHRSWFLTGRNFAGVLRKAPSHLVSAAHEIKEAWSSCDWRLVAGAPEQDGYCTWDQSHGPANAMNPSAPMSFWAFHISRSAVKWYPRARDMSNRCPWRGVI